MCLLLLSYRREIHDLFNWCDIRYYVNVYDDSDQAPAAGVALKPRHTRSTTETYHSAFCIRIVDIWNHLPPTSHYFTMMGSFFF